MHFVTSLLAAQTLRVFALSGDAPVDAKRATEQSIRAGVVGDGREVTVEATPIDDATVVFGCSANEPACIRAIAKALDAELLLHGRLDGASPHRLRLTFAHRDGRVLSTLDTKSSKSNQKAVITAVRDLVARGVGTPSAVGVVRVRSVPTGADVFRSGTMIGRTPLEVELPIGKQLLELRSGQRYERRVVEVGASPVELTVELDDKVVVAPVLPPSEESSGWIGPGVTMGAGAVAIVVGTVLLASARGTQTILDDGVALLPSPPTAADLTRLDELDRLAADGQSKATGGYIAVGTGVFALATGLVWGLVAQ